MRASEVVPAGLWEAEDEIDSVLIDHDMRHRRRVLLTTQLGRAVLLDLARATRLRHGDGLVVEDGDIIRVVARAEALLEISGDAVTLCRVAWHLGNRHLEVQVAAGGLRIRSEPVIARMVEGLGGRVAAVDAAFDPEPGAYERHV
jgi:urease accessory protein